LMTVAKLSILNSRIIKMTRKRVKNQSEWSWTLDFVISC
jgi:hypothetical protein